jgi:hypothetical protein
LILTTLREDAIDDLDIILDPDDFAKIATKSGGATIDVHFNQAMADGFGVENKDLEVMAKYSDVSAMVQGNTLVIGGVTYYLTESPRDDGSGITVFGVSKTL